MTRSTRYALSPTQEGMLLHALSNPAPGVDIEQMVWVLPEELDVEVLTSSWQETIDRHDALRSRFDWTSSPPRREIGDIWSLELSPLDWRSLSPAEQLSQLEEFLVHDRQRGFDLSESPLMRLALLQFGAADFRLVWTFHHAILDGRAFALLVREVLSRYDANVSGSAFEPTPPARFGDYLDWLGSSRDDEVAREFWTGALKDFTALDPLKVKHSAEADESPSSSHGHVETRLSRETVARLSDLAETCEVTLNTVLQGAWAVLLNRYTSASDVVFGATRACRHVPVQDADQMIGVCINTLPVRAGFEDATTVEAFLRALRAQSVRVRPFEHTSLAKIHAWSPVSHGAPLFESLVVFENYDLTETLQKQGQTWSRRAFHLHEQTNYALTLYCYAGSKLRLKISYARERISEAAARRMLGHLETLLEAMSDQRDGPVAALEMLTRSERHHLLSVLNNTQIDHPRELCIHELIEQRLTPSDAEPGVVEAAADAVALVCRDQVLTYRQVNERANQLARYLRRLGVGPGSLVGVALDRSVEMVVGLLGILKAGGAYVPLDPSYPKERLFHVIEDSDARLVLTQSSLLTALPEHDATCVCLDSEWPEISREATDSVESGAGPEDLAYVIYTSGSTGTPKGVMVEHRNVTNFFAAMDDRVGTGPGVWLAVTSISFDISVLELFWTLARGFKVVLVTDEDRLARPASSRASVRQAKGMDFALSYFASDLGDAHHERYRLLLEGAKFGDENGFSAVWTPERHFHRFGGLYSNPSVTSAALATLTQRIAIRAGSVVAPLHHPVRIAEEWALVDNLSGGRVGVSFASGWQSNDFVFAPNRYADRKQIMLDDIDLVRRLWRGETVTFPGVGNKEVPVKITPSPIQAELPVWVTAAANPETFRWAGEIGANVLTHLLGHQLETVEQKIRIYREARTAAGVLGKGQVTLMLHTYVSESMEAAKETVRGPMCRYLETSVDLIRSAPYEFPTYKVPSRSVAEKVEQGLKNFSDADMDALLSFAFDRYFETSGLFGTREQCLAMVDRCKLADVDEIACLIDFGVPLEQAMGGLRRLNEVRQQANQTWPVPTEEKDYSILAQLRAHEVTHLQCTPALARILADERGGMDGLAGLKRLMLGGEALPVDLVSRLRKVVRGEIHNMYGPTETTVWSTTDRLSSSEDFITIGTPVANTSVYVVDPQLRPVPVGVPGELLVGGEGVSRGYLNQDDLTRERFVPDPFGDRPRSRLYRTGDLVLWRPDGRVDFLGRLDHQVKIRGHRVELAEIEHVIGCHPKVTLAVVVARPRAGNESELVAFCVPRSGQSVDPSEYRKMLASKLPEFMMPRRFVHRDELPVTPNGKIDRKALVALDTTEDADGRVVTEAPVTELEESLASVLSDALELEAVGRDENFFALGANSLTLVRVASSLDDMFPGRLGLIDLFQHTTVKALATLITGSGDEKPGGAAEGGERGRRRREALLARRLN